MAVLKLKNVRRKRWERAEKLTVKLQKEGYTLTEMYPIKNEEGKLLFYRLRLESDDGLKEIRPMAKIDGKWVLKEPPFPKGKKPLYNLPKVAARPKAIVYVVEGENCVDQLKDLGLVATTSGGCRSASGADWSPLKGRSVIIWPDYDKDGIDYAKDVTGILKAQGCKVKWIDTSGLGLPPKGDVVDYIEANPEASRDEIKGLKKWSPRIGVERIAGNIKDAIIGMEDLNRMNIPKTEWITPWLKEGGLAMVAAERGLGKTFFGMSLAVALANGEKFMKWDIKKPCGVWYVDGELEHSDFRDRFNYFLSNGKATKARLDTLSHQTYWDRFEREVDIADQLVQEQMLDYLMEKREIKLLVLDNISCLTKVKENDSDEWRVQISPFLRNCRRIGVAVLLIHHTNKSGGQRGTSTREDQLDISIKLKEADKSYTDGAFFSVHFTKSRSITGPVREPFTARLLSNKDDLYSWELGSEETQTMKRLLALIEESGATGISKSDAAEELGVAKATITKCSRKLIMQGKIMPPKNDRSLLMSVKFATGKKPVAKEKLVRPKRKDGKKQKK